MLIALNAFVSGFSLSPKSVKLTTISRIGSKFNARTFNSKLFAEPDRKITRDNEQEYFESNVSIVPNQRKDVIVFNII
jgi:hypothetical protein